MAPRAPNEQALRRQEGSPHAVSSHVSGGSSRDTPVSYPSRPLLRSQDTTASSLNSCGPSPTVLHDPGCPHPKCFPHSSHHLLTGLPPSCRACDPAVTWRPTQNATVRAAGGKHRDQLTWEAEAVLDLAHGAVGGPHGGEGGLALRHVVLSGDQLLLGEELALTHLLRDFKTNAVPLCPDPVLGQAARRRAHVLRTGVYVRLHKHIPTQPDKNRQSLLHTLEPPETRDLTALSLFRQVQLGTSPPCLTGLM